MGAGKADIFLCDAQAFHKGKMGPGGLADGVRHLPAEKADLFKIVRLLDDGRKNFHIIPEIQIVLQHVIPKLFHRERTLRHLGHKGVAQVLGP